MKHNYPFIPQKTHDGCAIAVLTMVLNYFGISKRYLEVEASFINKNLSFLDLITYLNNEKINAFAYNANKHDLDKLESFPVIIHLKNHFVVVYGKYLNQLIIANPASLKIRVVNIKRLIKVWTGNYIDISKNFIKPINKVEYHLPYNVRLMILNIAILVLILIFMK